MFRLTWRRPGRRDQPGNAAVCVYDATRAAGTLVPPGRPGFGLGMVVHLAISMLRAETIARTLPVDHSAEWGAAAGFVIGVINDPPLRSPWK